MPAHLKRHRRHKSFPWHLRLKGKLMSTTSLSLLTVFLLSVPAPHAGKYFEIAVVDQQTGRGVPMVELSTVNGIRQWTDSNGLVAFYEPGLMGRRVFFYVSSHGYEFPKNGFGFVGTAVNVTEGGNVTLKIKRINIAQRLYRVTGAGIYRDSVLLGRSVPIARPVLNGLVLGSDSVLNVVLGGRIHWLWGDTNRPGYPLGNFHVPGATSLLPKDGGLDPEVGVDLEYFLAENGFAKETARMPGEGPTWLSGFVALEDGSGRERAFATYVKVRKPMVVYEHGLVEFDPRKQVFEKVVEFDEGTPAYLEGHPLEEVVDGVEYVYFANPFPVVRVRADPELLKTPAAYESYSCLKRGSRLEKVELDRDGDGRLRYGWKADTPAMGLHEQMKLVKDGRLQAEETRPHLTDVDSAKPIVAHRGSVYWNQFRNRYVMISTETFGTSMLGEVWYAEADTIEGPWAYARKIATHEKYSFYNPKQHPMFDKDNGRVIFFEGTYTAMFSGNSDETPRYNYNQIMYKLDLSDPRLVLPVAVYRPEEGQPRLFATAGDLDVADRQRPVAFFAYDLKAPGTFPLYQWHLRSGERVLRESLGPALESKNPQSPYQARPLFHALRPDMKQPPPGTVPLYEYIHKDGAKSMYLPGDPQSLPDYRRGEEPICLVWRDPTTCDTPHD